MASPMIVVDDDCMRKFLELKDKRTYRFIVFKIDDDKEKQTVVVDQLGEPSADYDDFLAALPEDDGRYCVYDLDFLGNDGYMKRKICFISWGPEEAKIRRKLLHASCNERIKSELDGIEVVLAASDYAEVSLEAIREHAARTTST